VPLFVRRRSGAIEDGWKIAGDDLNHGALVLQNAAGDKKAVSASEVVDLNVGRLIAGVEQGKPPPHPLGLLPANSQQILKQLEKGAVSDSLRELGVSPGFRRLDERQQHQLLRFLSANGPRSSKGLLELQKLMSSWPFAMGSPARQREQLEALFIEELKAPPKPQTPEAPKASPVSAPNQSPGIQSAVERLAPLNRALRVERSDGSIEGNWTVRGHDAKGVVTLECNGLKKTADVRALLPLNPELIPRGVEFFVRRSSGAVEDGWKVVGEAEKPGFLILANDNVGTKSVSAAEVVDLNVGRILGTSNGPPSDSFSLLPVATQRVAQSVRAELAAAPAEQSLVDSLVRTPGFRELAPQQQTALVERLRGIGDANATKVRASVRDLMASWQFAMASPNRQKVQLVALLAISTPLQGPSRNAPVRNDDDVVLKPALQRVRPAPGPGLDQSNAFRAQHRVSAGETIADGFFDGGRRGSVGSDGLVTSSREVVVVDRSRDPALRSHLEFARSLRSLSEGERAVQLSRYVDTLMTPKVYSPAGDVIGRGDPEKAVDAWVAQRRGHEVLLGDVGKLGAGVCRHRSLLFKVLADEAGLQVELVRGNMWMPNGYGGGHAWNEVHLSSGARVIFDVMNPQRAHAPLPVESARHYFDISDNPLYAQTKGV
jgi:hypothetical protein